MSNYTKTNPFDYLRVLPQYLAPHFVVTRLVYWLAQSKAPFIKNIFIRWFKNHYNVDMSLAINEDATSYESFNLFFTRALKPETRPVCGHNNCIVSPADGVVSETGAIEGDSILQAKGFHYNLKQLLAGQNEWCDAFANGTFSTIYLSPKDYHRVHMPCSGTLRQMTYVPGKLFSVSPLTTRVIPGVFSKNERILCFFETEFGPLAVIMVGAMIVGGMETVWQGNVTPPHGDRINHWYYTDGDSSKYFNKGDEMGRFNIGSTVILLFGENRMEWNKTSCSGSELIVGQEIATSTEHT